MLFVGEQDTDFGAEGGEEDSSILGEAVDAGEDVVDQVVDFYGGGFHAPIVGFEEHWVFC